MSNKKNPADTVEQWPIEKLIPYAKNSRTHSEEQIAQIAASIKEWGFTTAVLVDEGGGIIAGHGRLMAARRLGMAQVPVMVAKGWSEAQKRAYVIADNKLALNAGWDNEMLAIEIGELGDLGFDLELTGFTDEEIAALMPVEVTNGLTDEDDAPAVQENSITVHGDVWVMGKHRLMCGDSTSIDAVDALMEGNKAGLVFTDPPYGVNFQSNMSKRFDVLANDDKILDIAPVIWDFMGDDTAAFIWTSHHVYPEWRAQFSEFYKQTIIWHKGGGGMGDLNGQYALDYEIALFCTKGSPKFRGKRGMAVWEIGKDSASSYVHPTQKPTALAERAIEDFSNRGTTVMDLFGGSGSTLIACEKTNRQARLMELDPKYCDVIIKRWQEFTGKIATHAETGQPFAEVTNGKN
jgi:DNA modification methylase